MAFGIVKGETFELVSWQQKDLDWLKEPGHSKNMILYDKGFGKTVIATKRNIDAGVGTHVVCCPANAIRAWRDHFYSWNAHFNPGYDLDVFIVRDTPAERKRMWGELKHGERTKQKRIFITTFGSAQRDWKVGSDIITPAQWKNVDQIDVDEAHRARNRKSVNFKTLQPILRSHPYFSFLSGTPISRGAQEFWSFFNCINPRYFSSYWRFVGQFCETIDGFYGKEIIGPRNMEAFWHLLRTYARIRDRTDPEIAPFLPKKIRVPRWVSMNKDQVRISADLDMNKMSWTKDGELILAGTSMETVMRVRQLLVCPKILDPSLGMGAAFDDFMERLEDSAPIDQHTVIFTPFKKAFPHFRTALEAKGFKVSQLSGGITTSEQDEQIAKWRKEKGVMLCTIPYAESFDLEPAREAHFIGYEWDPNMNTQAEGRLTRLTTTWMVTIYYYRYEDASIDAGMGHVVDFKQSSINQVMSLGRA